MSLFIGLNNIQIFFVIIKFVYFSYNLNVVCLFLDLRTKVYVFLKNKVCIISWDSHDHLFFEYPNSQRQFGCQIKITQFIKKDLCIWEGF